MKIISHRGNIDGVISSKENSPEYIDTAINLGYDVEVDIRFINGKFYLGHDTPDYEISETWMELRRDKIWFHCKNLESASRIGLLDGLKFFCHTSDSFVLTSTNHIWVHDLNMKLDNRCIIPLLSDKDIISYNNKIVYGVCTDYISFAEYSLKQKGLYK